jgi:serine/threonine-protein kinase
MRDSNLAHAYACNGQTAEARKLLAELEAAQHDFPLYAALVYLGLNEREKMWNCLEQAFAERVVLLPGWLNSDPRFQVLCDEPRFQELLRRIGLPSDETAQDESINTAGKAKTTGANTSLDDARLNAPAKAITDSTAQSQTSELTVAGSGKERKHIFVSGLVIFLIVAIGFGYYFLSERKSALSAGDKKSLAVLPFANASKDPNAEYLSDGITESVINNLSQLAGLKVMSRNSAFRFKDNQTDTKMIASQLGVETLVTGDIKQLGDKLVINVRLIDASDDSQIWGNQYVKTTADVIAAQNEIAQAVAQNLRMKLTSSEQKQLGKNYTENVEAYQLYLRGRYHHFKLTQPEIRKGIDFYGQAIEVDPNYALAFAGIADAYRTLPIAGWNVASKEAFPQAKAAAKRALEIDENLAEAYIALGWIGFLYDWDWSAAESELKKAIELSPNNSDAHRAYAHLFSTVGRHDEAVAEGRRARELDPLSLITNALEGQFLFYAGRDDEAIARFNKTLEIEPNFWIAHNGLGRVYIRQGHYTEAIAVLTKARELSGGSTEPITQLGYALAKSGNRERAQVTLEELKSIAAENFVPAYSFAMIYNGLDEKEEALNYLEKSFQEREVQITFVKVDTRWDWLRAEPRFIEIIKHMNFE